MPIIAIALLIAAALGGGAAVAAQQSLPGDPLWGFKVHVNEGVQGALSTSDESKANWDIGSIEARLKEAQSLEDQGKLDASAQADLAANIAEHAKGAEDAIGKLDAAGSASAAADAATRFQAAMEQFVTLTGGATTTAQANGDLTQVVREAFSEASTISAQASAHAQGEVGSKGDNAGVEVSADAAVTAGATSTGAAGAGIVGKPSIKGVGSDDEGGDGGMEEGIFDR